MFGSSLFLITLLVVTKVFGQCRDLSESLRIVNGTVGSAFQLTFDLPGRYTRIVADQIKVFTGSNCSTIQFTCNYTQESAYCARVTLSGVISSKMNWVLFEAPANRLIPISVAIFPDGHLSNTPRNNLVPDTDNPFFIKQRSNKNVTLRARYNGNNPTVGIHLTFWSIHAYEKSSSLNFDNVKLYPELLQLNTVMDGNQKIYSLVVRRKYNVDYYGFTDGTNWETYMIVWDSGARESVKNY